MFRSAGMLIFDPQRQKVLLGLEPRRGWSDFGGARQKDEDAITTALRECFEESGVVVEREEVEEGPWVDLEVHYKLFVACKTLETIPEVPVGGEKKSLRFFSLQELFDCPSLYQPFRKLLERHRDAFEAFLSTRSLPPRDYRLIFDARPFRPYATSHIKGAIRCCPQANSHKLSQCSFEQREQLLLLFKQCKGVLCACYGDSRLKPMLERVGAIVDHVGDFAAATEIFPVTKQSALPQLVGKKRSRPPPPELPWQISADFFLGNRLHAADHSALSSLGIECVVNCASEVRSPQSGALPVLRLELVDQTKETELRKACERAVSWVGDRVCLVHCFMGASRSVSVLAFMLMAKERVSLRDALKRIKKANPRINPNVRFLFDLSLAERDLLGVSIPSLLVVEKF